MKLFTYFSTFKFWGQHSIVSKKEVLEQINEQPFNNCVMEAAKCDNFYKEFWSTKKSLRLSFLLSLIS